MNKQKIANYTRKSKYPKSSKNKPSKHRNKRVKFNGINFDSLAERDYYIHLLYLQKLGEVTDIDLQPRYLIFESYVFNGKKVQTIYYKADFKVTYLDGSEQVVDVKGDEKMVTSVFKIKKKLFEHKYKQEIKIVYKRDIGG